MYRSGNGGATWPLASADLQYADVRDIVTDSRGARRVYAATTRGVYAITEKTAPAVDVQARSTQSGSVNKDPGQAGAACRAPSLSSSREHLSHGQFHQSRSSWSFSSRKAPILGQTLADRRAGRPGPPAGRPHGAPPGVCEYDFDASASSYFPSADGSAATGIDAGAVQLFRCVEGEDRIWLRLNRGTASWHPSVSERVLGITIGAGSGVWPPVGNSNWGASGEFRQENTQFFGDMRGYDFTAQGRAFPRHPPGFFQKSGFPTAPAPARARSTFSASTSTGTTRTPPAPWSAPR